MSLDWKYLLAIVLAQVIGFVVFQVGGMSFVQQDKQVFDRYESDQGYDVFMCYMDKIDDPQKVLAEFQKAYPDYQVISWQVVVKVRQEQTFDVMVIFARSEQNE